MATRIAHVGDDTEQRWIVNVTDADLTSWPEWRMRQLRRGLELVRMAIAGEREPSQLERVAQSIALMTRKGADEARRRRLRTFGEQLRTDLEHGRS